MCRHSFKRVKYDEPPAGGSRCEAELGCAGALEAACFHDAAVYAPGHLENCGNEGKDLRFSVGAGQSVRRLVCTRGDSQPFAQAQAMAAAQNKR
jgi:hypothetical protein